MKRDRRSGRRYASGWMLLCLVSAFVLMGGVGPAMAQPPPEDGAFGMTELPPEAGQVAGADIVPAGAAMKHPGLDSAMARLAQAARTSAQEALGLARAQGVRVSAGRVHVQVVTHAAGLERAREAIRAAGGEVTGVGNDGTLIQGWLPVERLEAVAAHEDVYLIRQPAMAYPLDRLAAGSSTTEGLSVINGPAWHGAGYTGAGVKIAIIDGGFEGYPGLLGTDLPASVTVKNFVDGETDAQVDGGGEHGTACAEIIHDIAPSAALYLVKIQTNVDLAEAVAWVKDIHHVDVISTSLGWFTLTPGDGTGEFADLVQQARASSILWATAAGNYRESHWGGPFSDPDANGTHNFAGTQEVNYFGPGDGNAYVIPAGYTFCVFVRWDDWTAVNQDYDLYLLRWGGASWTVVGSSTDTQDGGPGQAPTEAACVETSGDAAPYGFEIVRESATRAVNFELFAPNIARLDELLYARSLANLGDAPDAMTVAALDVDSPYPQESYSSEGPTNGPGGTAAGGFTKPDISGYANVSTESYGPAGFNGTSAATPHVAGAAAVVLSAYPGHTPDQVQSFLEGRAINMGAPGMDTQFGYGRLHLGDPVAAAPDVQIVKSASAGALNPGDPVTFILSVANVGNGVAADPVVVDIVPSEVLTPSYDSTLTITPVGGTPYTWDLEPLGPGVSGTITINGWVAPHPAVPFSIENTATISDPADTTPGNNTSSVSVVVGGYSVYLPLVTRGWPPIPCVPTLNPIANPDGDGNYAVTWNPACRADSYTLQEDDDCGFPTPITVYQGDGTSWNAVDRLPGTYCYRVKASNGWGDSDWSHPCQCVTVGGWVTILDDDFEGSFPGPWEVKDSDSRNGRCYWWKRDCRANGGNYSAWCTGGGDCSSLSCGSDYPEYMFSWMIYGPFSLADATAAELTFDFWADTEKDWDFILWGASTDGTSYAATGGSGKTGGWISDEVLDLADVPGLGSVLGEDQVWIAFIFISDLSVTDEGAFVDNVLLRKWTGGSMMATAPSLEPGCMLELGAPIDASTLDCIRRIAK